MGLSPFRGCSAWRTENECKCKEERKQQNNTYLCNIVAYFKLDDLIIIQGHYPNYKGNGNPLKIMIFKAAQKGIIPKISSPCVVDPHFTTHTFISGFKFKLISRVESFELAVKMVKILNLLNESKT